MLLRVLRNPKLLIFTIFSLINRRALQFPRSRTCFVQALLATSSPPRPTPGAQLLYRNLNCHSFLPLRQNQHCRRNMAPQLRAKSTAATSEDDKKPVARSSNKRTSATARSKSPAKRSKTKASSDAIKGSPKESPKGSPKKKAMKKTTTSKKAATKKATAKKTSSPAKKKAPAHQVLTAVEPLPKLWDASNSKDSYTFKIATWNVAGLRAILKKTPNALAELCQRHDLDVLCLQETKLQDIHLEDPKLGNIGSTLLAEEGYDSHFSCSTAKKGYSGTAVFVKKRGKKVQPKAKQTSMASFLANSNDDDMNTAPATSSSDSANLPIDVKNLIPENVSFEMGKPAHDAEGRIITVDFPLFSLINVYVPNAGQKLERLDYRTKEWDKDLLAFAQTKNQVKPTLWLGDLNVAHTNLEVWNDGAKHLAKQAGVTAEERASFQAQLDAGFVDSFRHLHPSATNGGHYTYWSQRAGNREPNKGLRLDYFVCAPEFFNEEAHVQVRDSYMDMSQMGSDHCPAILELEIKK